MNKKIVTGFIFALIAINTSAQVNKPAAATNDDRNVYSTGSIEVIPEFPGGTQMFYNYIARSFKSPSTTGLFGKVIVNFVIEKDGSITDIKIVKDEVGHGAGEEAIRVLKECAKWKPGEQFGQKVRVLYSLPITVNTK
jgi:protein TonB